MDRKVSSSRTVQKASDDLDYVFKALNVKDEHAPQGRVKAETIKYRAGTQGVEVQRTRLFETTGESKNVSGRNTKNFTTMTENYQLDGASSSNRAAQSLGATGTGAANPRQPPKPVVSYNNGRQRGRQRGNQQPRYNNRGRRSNYHNNNTTFYDFSDSYDGYENMFNDVRFSEFGIMDWTADYERELDMLRCENDIEFY